MAQDLWQSVLWCAGIFAVVSLNLYRKATAYLARPVLRHVG